MSVCEKILNLTPVDLIQKGWKGAHLSFSLFDSAVEAKRWKCRFARGFLREVSPSALIRTSDSGHPASPKFQQEVSSLHNK